LLGSFFCSVNAAPDFLNDSGKELVTKFHDFIEAHALGEALEVSLLFFGELHWSLRVGEEFCFLSACSRSKSMILAQS
jgi:hypothetical protein